MDTDARSRRKEGRRDTTITDTIGGSTMGRGRDA